MFDVGKGREEARVSGRKGKGHAWVRPERRCHVNHSPLLQQISGGLLQSFPFLRHFCSKNHSFNVVLSGFLLVNEFIKVRVPRNQIFLVINCLLLLFLFIFLFFFFFFLCCVLMRVLLGHRKQWTSTGQRWTQITQETLSTFT